MEDIPSPQPPVRPPRSSGSTSVAAASSNSTSSDTTTTTEDYSFASLARNAFSTTASAQRLDGSGSKEAAFKEYDRALTLIDKAIKLSLSAAHVEEDAGSSSIDIPTQLRITRKHILERVTDLQHEGNNNNNSATGASGPVLEPRQPQFPPAYGELEAALEEIAAAEMEGGTEGLNPLPVHAKEVYFIPGEVQIYFISAEDNVSAPSYPSFLRLVTLEPGGGGLEGAGGVVASSVPAFLQVGDWTYPLVPQHSPLFRSTEGIYIFPDLSSPNLRGSYVGLILPESLPASSRTAFEDTLLSLVGTNAFPPVLEHPATTTATTEEATTTKPEKPPRPPAPATGQVAPLPAAAAQVAGESAERRLSTKIAEGAEVVSRGLIAGASKTSNLIDRGAAFINSKIEPAREKSVIKPEVKAGMKTAKTVSGKAVQVSGFIVTQVGRGTIALGRYMAPHVHKASTKFLVRASGLDEKEASDRVDSVLEVTTGAVVGFGTVYFGLEHAARTLVSSLATNSVSVVQHRYGDEAGELAGDTAATAGNAALTAWNAKNLAPKAVAKRVAKDTGRLVIKAHQEKRGNKSSGVPGAVAATETTTSGSGQDNEEEDDRTAGNPDSQQKQKSK
ncbi:spartin isoform X2 [Folsomia candida]|uniref:spartin isoform X2 n=1 Tax=Folsomia candida TaxID=158441 RepID=UPI000B905EC7|nr:spartin isoform X2 [Folsomia candida]